jgi:sarcosine oxidase delta subunit
MIELKLNGEDKVIVQCPNCDRRIIHNYRLYEFVTCGEYHHNKGCGTLFRLGKMQTEYEIIGIDEKSGGDSSDLQ